MERNPLTPVTDRVYIVMDFDTPGQALDWFDELQATGQAPRASHPYRLTPADIPKLVDGSAYVVLDRAQAARECLDPSAELAARARAARDVAED